MQERLTILLISVFSGLATGLGAFIVVSLRQFSARTLSALLGMAAGVMVAISTFDLLPAAITYGSVFHAVTGFVGGGLMMFWLDSMVPHLHYLQKEGHANSYAQMGYFIALGIALHNVPEGLAVGAGYEAAPKLGFLIAAAIAMHNIPEGIGIAACLKMAGTNPWRIIAITCLAGLFTPIGTVLGFIFFNLSPVFIAVAMGMAAGAMLYIVSDELIPESHKQHSHSANFGFIAGILFTFVMEKL